jgi:integrase
VAKYPDRIRTRRLGIEELSRVWKAIDSEKEWEDFFKLLILTGARRGAFSAMRWRDLDLEAGVWTIPVEWAKSKREMAIPLCAEAVRILKVRRDNCLQLGQKKEWVWPSTENSQGRRESAAGHVVSELPPVLTGHRL